MVNIAYLHYVLVIIEIYHSTEYLVLMKAYHRVQCEYQVFMNILSSALVF
jgi:hypothetical protein